MVERQKQNHTLQQGQQTSALTVKGLATILPDALNLQSVAFVQTLTRPAYTLAKCATHLGRHVNIQCLNVLIAREVTKLVIYPAR